MVAVKQLDIWSRLVVTRDLGMGCGWGWACAWGPGWVVKDLMIPPEAFNLFWHLGQDPRAER